MKKKKEKMKNVDELYMGQTQFKDSEERCRKLKKPLYQNLKKKISKNFQGIKREI